LKRWFGLDDPAVQDRLRGGPKLLTYIAGVETIEEGRKAMPVDPGKSVEVTRGELKWSFSLPENGQLIDDGALPYLIAWPTAVTPVTKMANQHIDLLAIRGARLSEMVIDWPCAIGQSAHALEISLRNAAGREVTVSSHGASAVI
jgi:hypothetical protein